MENQKISIPDNLEIKFTAKEVGDIKDYISKNFIHDKVRAIIDFMENRMLEAYQESQPKQS